MGEKMAKVYELDMDDEEAVCNVGKALSSPTRIVILKLLYTESLNVGEIADKLQIPASSAALHVKILENANLINTEVQPGNRGTMKLCSRKKDIVTLYLSGGSGNVSDVVSVNMPIGYYTDCEITPTCGIAGVNGVIGNEDRRESFYLPERVEAQILWSSGGYVEYKFPNTLPSKAVPKKVFVTMEICSEAPNYREDWKSEITMWMNGIDCGVFLSPGDFGARKGKITPKEWASGNTQYGMLTTWEVQENGSFVNGTKMGNHIVEDLKLEDKEFITVRIGNKKDAEYVGGFNIFGEKFGDHPQNIVLSIEY